MFCDDRYGERISVVMIGVWCKVTFCDDRGKVRVYFL